eukprot:11030800-Karenia_brevis.AAC.1
MASALGHLVPAPAKAHPEYCFGPTLWVMLGAVLLRLPPWEPRWPIWVPLLLLPTMYVYMFMHK